MTATLIRGGRETDVEFVSGATLWELALGNDDDQLAANDIISHDGQFVSHSQAQETPVEDQAVIAVDRLPVAG